MAWYARAAFRFDFGRMKAMILAAGRGARMRPLTDTVPKPLLKINGRPLIDWHLEKLASAGFRDIVINISYMADAIKNHVGDGARYGVTVQYSPEPTALETGGGIATARDWLGDDWFLLVSADIYSDIDYARLATMGKNLGKADAALMLVPHHVGLIGEYALEADRVVFANVSAAPLPHYTWASVGVFRTSLFAAMPKRKPFTLLKHFQAWAGARRMKGEVFDGVWENLGTPREFAALNARLA